MSEWIEWNGGECPVGEGQKVFVRFRNLEATEDEPSIGSELRWSHGGWSGDIVAYKLADESNDPVNHPNHYTSGKVECIDALEAATVNLTGIEAVCTANAIKYLWRWKQKGGRQDLEKAQWYIKHLLERTE